MKARTTSEDLVLDLDIAPTLLDIAGVAVPPEMQGKSTVPLAEGKPNGSRRKSRLKRSN